jgi:HSP20 family protein
MDVKKLAPWNWFKKEEESLTKTSPVPQEELPAQNYSYSSPMPRLHSEFHRILDETFRGFGLQPFGLGGSLSGPEAGGVLRPNLNVSATDDHYKISVEVPGVAREDVKLDLVDDALVIQGEKQQEKETQEKRYYRMERSYGAFRRILSLPGDADQEGIDANFKDGVLTVLIRRKPAPKIESRRIEVNRG